MEYLPEAVSANPTAFSVPGPVDQQGSSLDFIDIKKPPVTTVLTVFPIITHHEDVVFGNPYGAEVIARHDGFVAGRVGMDREGLILYFAVDGHLLVAYFYHISRNGDDAFDKVTSFIFSGI